MSKGLYNRYVVSKADGSASDPAAIYFVLRPNSKDKVHAEASKEALLIYAKRVQSFYPELAADIRALVASLNAGEPPVEAGRKPRKRPRSIPDHEE
jgi:hypothetical protein